MVERKYEGRCQTSNFTYHDFHPSAEWLQDPSNYILLIQLPGFKKEDIRVKVDCTGRLTVMGAKQERARFEQSYIAPAGSNIDKISGKFEDGCLVLTFPKAATVEPEKAFACEGKKAAAPAPDKEGKKEATKEEMPMIQEEKKEEPAHQEIPNIDKEKKLDKLTMEKIEKLLEELTGARSVKKASEHMTLIHCEKGLAEMPQEKERRKRRLIWDLEEDFWIDWLDRGLVDAALEKVNRNRKVIAVALAAFSVGFYVSHKLRTRGG